MDNTTGHGEDDLAFLPTASTLRTWAVDDVRAAERAVAASGADLKSATAFIADPAGFEVTDVVRAALEHRRALDVLEHATRHARMLSVLVSRTEAAARSVPGS